MSYKEFKPKMRLIECTMADGSKKYDVLYGVKCILGFRTYHRIGWDRWPFCDFSTLYISQKSCLVESERDALYLFNQFVNHINQRRREKAGRKIIKETIVK